MLKVKIQNLIGKENEEMELDPEIFDITIKPEVVQQVVEAYLANQRTVLAHTKVMSEVRGGGIKPWRQKGTGRARHGSIRSPLWKGGGVTFGPRQNRNFSKKVNKKIKTKALFMVLTDKLQNNKLVVVDDLKTSDHKTKALIKLLDSLKLKSSKALICLEKKNINIQKAAKNLENYLVLPADSLNVYSLLKYDTLVITKKAVEKIKKHFKKV